MHQDTVQHIRKPSMPYAITKNVILLFFCVSARPSDVHLVHCKYRKIGSSRSELAQQDDCNGRQLCAAGCWMKECTEKQKSDAVVSLGFDPARKAPSLTLPGYCTIPGMPIL